jgi:hypothetical protein
MTTGPKRVSRWRGFVPTRWCAGDWQRGQGTGGRSAACAAHASLKARCITANPQVRTVVSSASRVSGASGKTSGDGIISSTRACLSVWVGADAEAYGSRRALVICRLLDASALLNLPRAHRPLTELWRIPHRVHERRDSFATIPEDSAIIRPRCGGRRRMVESDCRNRSRDEHEGGTRGWLALRL